jgi:fatty acid desaturase
MAYRSAPGWLVIPVLAVDIAWFMSLQHELLHGHPTRNRAFNRLLGLLPLAVWFPYDQYRDSHLAHHRDQLLTLPGVDPESNYTLPEELRAASSVMRTLKWAQRTVLGRLFLGPAFAIARQLRALSSAANWALPAFRRTWLEHLLLLVLQLWAVSVYFGLPPWAYLLLVAYPGLGLALFRSFYEHRIAVHPNHRIVINEAAWPWRLLYLNNNYHAVHHAYPGLPWYDIAPLYWKERAHFLRENGGFFVPGYFYLFRHHALRPVDSPEFIETQVLPGLADAQATA